MGQDFLFYVLIDGFVFLPIEFQGIKKRFKCALKSSCMDKYMNLDMQNFKTLDKKGKIKTFTALNNYHMQHIKQKNEERIIKNSYPGGI